MGVKGFNVMSLGKVSLMDPRQLGYQDSIDLIRDELHRTRRSFVKIGWYLKHIQDNEMYKADGYTNIYEFASDKFNLLQPTATRFMQICEQFSIDHDSPELDEKYIDFNMSQLFEMLPMKQEDMEKVTPNMTVADIRKFKKESKEPVVEKNDEDIPGQTSIEEDFKEIMPDSDRDTSCSLNVNECTRQKWGTSPEQQDNDEIIIDSDYREIEEPEPEEEKIAMSQSENNENVHDESWFVRQYAEINAKEAAELYKICLSENNNSDRAKAVQKYIAPYGCHGISCDEWDFSFHGFNGGLDFRIGQEQMHLKYGMLVIELMKILDEKEHQEGEESCNSKCGRIEEPYILEDENKEVESSLKDGLAVTKRILEQEKKTLDDMLKFDDLPEMTVLRQKTIVGALAAMVCDLEDADQEPEPQPELPVMRNDSQRRDFIDSYQEWPVWIENQATGEKYNRYDLKNGTSFVVKSYFHKCFDYKNTAKRWKDRYHNDWGAEEYYILENGMYFKDCLTNKSAMIDFLKKLQKEENNNE